MTEIVLIGTVPCDLLDPPLNLNEKEETQYFLCWYIVLYSAVLHLVCNSLYIMWNFKTLVYFTHKHENKHIVTNSKLCAVVGCLFIS